jgi:hypothetical protein
MHRARLELAFQQLKSEQWSIFEQYASAFLTQKYGELRTLASPKGDGGRDATIFSKKSSEDVAFQYSVTMDWNGKILATARRLSKTYPDTRLLVYVTNKTIGAQGDQLKTKLLEKFGLVLDIHDSHWFLDRYWNSPAFVDTQIER